MAEHTGQSSQLFPVTTGRNAQFLATVAGSRLDLVLGEPLLCKMFLLNHISKRSDSPLLYRIFERLNALNMQLCENFLVLCLLRLVHYGIDVRWHPGVEIRHFTNSRLDNLFRTSKARLHSAVHVSTFDRNTEPSCGEQRVLFCMYADTEVVTSTGLKLPIWVKAT